MKTTNLSEHFLQTHPRESAKVLEDFPADELAEYLQHLPNSTITGILRYFLPEHAIACLVRMEASQSAQILELMGVDAAARLLRNMHNIQRQNLLNALSTGFAYRLKTILRYPNGTVGQYMSPNIFMVRDDMLPAEIFDAARNATSELLGDIFIVNDIQHLVGIIDIKSLVFADQASEVKKIMRRPDVVLNARANLDYIKDNPKWQYCEALPVVDHNNVLVGILKRSVMQEAVTGHEGHNKEDEGIVETVMDVAELFWDLCIGLIVPKVDASREGLKDDRK